MGNQLTKEEEDHLKTLKEFSALQFTNDKIAFSLINIVLPPLAIGAKECPNNLNEVKGLLCSSVGIIFDNDIIKIMYKSEYFEFLGRITFRFESKIGKMDNISFMVSNSSNNGMDFNISPVKYD